MKLRKSPNFNFNFWVQGAIAITASSSVESQGREIMIKNVDRKWVLIAKTEIEAAWWCLLLSRSKQGIPSWAAQKSYTIDLSYSVAMPAQSGQRRATPTEMAPPPTAPSPSQAVAAPIATTVVAVVEEPADRKQQPPAPAPKPGGAKAEKLAPAVQERNKVAPSIPKRSQSSMRRASVCVRPVSQAPKAPPPIAPRKSLSLDEPETAESYVALAEYACEEGEGTLDFGAGEKIKVVDKSGGTGEPDEWWFVKQTNGSTGWCPASFLSEDLGSAGPTTDAQADTVTVLRMVRASYDSSASTPDELSFGRGEMIEVLAEADEYGWCRGRIHGKVGIFPANYVEDDMM